MIPDALITVFAALLGLLIGSFSNVLIWRLPRHESINFPPSHCPHCNHQLAPLDLVPVLSWVALRGKCRYCGAPISPRYPVVELITGLGYALLSLAFPASVIGWSLLGLCLLFTFLLVSSVIDTETYTIPDELTLPGAVIGLIFGVVNARSSGAAAAGLPVFEGALRGMLLGAGLLIVIDLFGSWVLRRLRERSYPEFPLGFQQIGVSLLAGAWLGVWWGVAAGVLSAVLNMTLRRVLRVPEWLTLGGTLLSLAVAGSGTGIGPGLILMVQGSVAAAGGMALLCGLYWWLRPGAEDEDEPYDPSAMGFGDVKLAALIGAFLGWEKLLVAVVVAVFAGAVLGVLQLVVWKENRLKFGPYLAIGAVVALLFGPRLIEVYRSTFGL
ncbi:prepilin peptidase [Deinococcus sp. KNUC1210]|uniref:prepilin peptidase n=1 Tax=Deinococcus sp. KNUC1210 TaxID=2917691 RepID=UPI001EEF7D99|nr:A24 family peptidase [Deinococcus sp. KNUC1210]ULH14900.1 prepilin peptidase [Deinococcus sp. KNUC1210]